MRRVASVLILAGCAAAPVAAPPERAASGRREAASREAALHLAEGDARADRGDHRAAVAAYDSALALDPGCARARASRGAAVGRLGQDAEQVRAQTAALRDAPDYAYACMTRASAKLRLGDFTGAAEDCDRALALIEAGPLDDRRWIPRTRWLRGLARVRLGEPATALADLDEALASRDPHVPHARARVARAEARLLLGDPVEAQDDLAIARGAGQLGPAELRWVGWLSALASALEGDRLAAEETLRELARTDPADVDPPVWLRLLGLDAPPPVGGPQSPSVGWSLGQLDDAAFLAQARGWEGAALGMIGLRAERAGDLARAREKYRQAAASPGPPSLPRIWAVARLSSAK